MFLSEILFQGYFEVILSFLEPFLIILTCLLTWLDAAVEPTDTYCNMNYSIIQCSD